MPTDDTSRAISPARSPDTRTAIEARLLEIWLECLPDQPEQGARIIQRYAEPHRHYHDTAHLAAVLDSIDRLADTDHDLFLVRLAGFFHDAVYAIPPGQVTNEEASARLAIRELSRAGLEQEEMSQVARLVRLTESHVPGSRDPGGELLCDADLAVLAGTPQEYAAYVAAVEREYAGLPRAEFAAGRLDVLLELRGRDLFRTGKGRALNERARANIESEVQSLAAELGFSVEVSDG